MIDTRKKKHNCCYSLERGDPTGVTNNVITGRMLHIARVM